MSISSFPRLYLKGEISFDPSLSNNFPAYNQIDVTLDKDQLRTLMPGATTPDEFRKGLHQALAGSWNHFGTHRAVFEKSMLVTGVSLMPGVIDTADALVQKQVQMKGKLVDLSPHTDMGTQVFFDQIQFGGVGAGLQLTRRKRMTCRFLNMQRNVGPMPSPEWSGAYFASGTWEVAFPRDGLRLQNPAASSFLTALETLLASSPSVLGVAFRFRTYRTLYYQNGIKNTTTERPRTGKELREFYADDKNFSNPAYSMIVGSLFPWVEGDHEGHPGGRIVGASRDVPSLNGARPAKLGTAFVEINAAARRMTVDFGDLVPERDKDLSKDDVGAIALVAQDGDTSVPLLAIQPADYAQPAYEREAGLFDVDLVHLTTDQWTAVQRGTLQVTAQATVAMVEVPLVVVVEDRDIYADQGDDVSISIRVMQRGLPAPVGTQVLVEVYDLGDGATKLRGTLAVDAAGHATAVVPAAGSPSIVAVAFRAFLAGEPEPAGALVDPTDLNATVNSCALIRTLPFDDKLEADTNDSQLTWSWVHENILSVWSVTNPVMARTSGPSINKPLHDRATMEQHAARIKKVIARGNIESDSYMPVTRDLSRGKRRLLERWCDLVIAGTAPHEELKFKAISLPTLSKRVASEE